jgi:ubiquinone/menaquinone biosynthesis C-methylase UbiE
MKSKGAVWILAAFPVVILCAQTQHQHHPPASSAEYAKVLEDPSRDEWQKPHEVMNVLALQPGDTVADIGAGSGYFARRFAHHAGTVLAVDIDAGLLEICAKDAPANLKTVLSAPDDPKLDPASVDLVFICDVLHHIDGRKEYLEKVRNVLKSAGRVALIDFYKRQLPIGPPPEMKIDRAEAIREFKAAGFRLEQEHRFLPYQYFLIFKRNDAPRRSSQGS